MLDIDITEEAVGNNPKARSELFEEADATDLENIQKLRKDLTKILTTDGNGKLQVPEKTAEKILLAQLIDGQERLIMTRARLRISSKVTNEVGDLADIVARALLGFKSSNRVAAAEEQCIPGEFLRVETVPGEMDIGNLSMSMDKISESS